MEDVGAWAQLTFYLNVHQLNEPVPEEEWLRANTKPIRESRFGLGVVTEFHPLEAKTF